jgi:hypothetical protein
MRRFVFVLALWINGCASEPPEITEPEPPPPGSPPYLAPAVAYGGYDGFHPFHIYFASNLAGDVNWSLDDPRLGHVYQVPAARDKADWGQSWAVVEPMSAGRTKIRGTAGGATVVSELVIAAYAPATVQTGRHRFYGTSDGCYVCHDPADGGESWTFSLGFYPDEDVLRTVTDGPNHHFDLSDEERAGIVPFLRALQNKGVD